VDSTAAPAPKDWTPARPGWRPCSARRTSGDTCRAPAIKGGTVCIAHGGRAPQVRAAADRRVVAARAARIAQRQLGGHLAVDPLGALEDAVREAAANVAVLRELAARVPPDLLAAGLAPALALYADERDRLVRFAKAAADAGVAERGQTLREAEGAMIAAVFDAVFRDPRLGLLPAQRETARAIAAEGLRRLEAEAIATVDPEEDA
jgi:hypothetical protein